MTLLPIIRVLLRFWWALTGIAGIVTSIAFSAEFGWDAISDDPRAFFKEWAIDWVPALATVAVAVVVLQQVRVIRRGQQIEYAPVLRLDLEQQPAGQGGLPIAVPHRDLYADPFKDAELDSRRDAGAEPQYVMLTVQNLQKHAAGSANDVEVVVTLSLPDQRFSFEFPLSHIEPGATETHVIVNLGGLNWSKAEITSIDFYDDSDNHYTTAHGLAHLTRDLDGRVRVEYVTIG